ncbi:MAG: transcription termination/antitermination protein NusA [Dehalococcoidia bacterium]|nr:MAG: transcription termination/antitermination protein NusA [Dehalococcoidia bacterium]
MKSDFLLAITQLSAEKGLSKEVVLAAVESALASAYRKNNFAPNQVVSVKISPATGKVEVWAEKTVVKQVTDPRAELTLAEAKKLKKDAKVDDIINVESTPQNAGRIAAQTAKQVILQRLHEAEHSAIFDEFSGKAGDIVSGVVRRVEPKQVFIDLGRTEAVMPSTEQSPAEHYRAGQRLRVYLVEVAQSARGPMLIVSRSHPNLLRRLLELEVPEIFSGTVEIKSVAREAGFRSKVAVAAKQEGVDAVGCCVGLRGIRIQNIVSELGGEKIDVVNWNPAPAIFIANALSPSQVVAVKVDEKRESAIAVIPDRLLSLAIGKEGQNVRLAVKLTGWRIDIKSATDAEKEKAEVETVKAAKVAAERAETGEEPAAVAAEPAPVLAGVTTAAPARAAKGLRFAEDILIPAVVTPEAASKDKKKKKKTGKETAEDGIRLKKARRGSDIYDTDEEI